MTEERTSDRDPRFDPDRTADGTADEPRDGDQHDKPPASGEEANPWTREGPDAPDAADIAEPEEQL